MVHRRVPALLVGAGMLIAWLGGSVLSQAGGSPRLDWFVTAAGGQQSDSGSYRVNGTIGQSMAGPPPAVSEERRITAGYWTQFAPSPTPTPTQPSATPTTPPAPTATPTMPAPGTPTPDGEESTYLPFIKK
jgi:hypothetical protein